MKDDQIKNIFSKNLNRLLEEKGATQLELANYIGVSNTTVNNYVQGYNTPRMDKVDKICDFFGITRSELLEEKQNKEQMPKNYFTSANEAIEFLLSQNVIMAYTGVDIDTLSDDEKIQFANRLLDYTKLLGYDYKND